MKKTVSLILLWVLCTTLSVQASIYAVVVGIEKYDGTVSNLNASVDDAQKVYEYLRAGKNNKVILLTDKQATKQNILYAMKKVYALANENDMIVFYFSGHGGPGVFCTTNFQSGRMGLRHSEIRKAFRSSKAKHKLCIADACYSGSIVNNSSSNNTYNSQYNAPKENIVIFMSSRDDETSIESYSANAGIFTQYFIKGMGGAADANKDRGISLFELYAYVRRNVRRDTQNRQTPVMFGQFKKRAIISRY